MRLATAAPVLKHVTQADAPMGTNLCGGDDPLVKQFDEEGSRDIEQCRSLVGRQVLVHGNQGHIIALREQRGEHVKRPDEKVWTVVLLAIRGGQHDRILGAIVLMLAQKRLLFGHALTVRLVQYDRCTLNSIHSHSTISLIRASTAQVTLGWLRGDSYAVTLACSLGNCDRCK